MAERQFWYTGFDFLPPNTSIGSGVISSWIGWILVTQWASNNELGRYAVIKFEYR